MFLMMLWQAWHIRNEVVRHELPPSMEVSKRFLVSYLDSIIGIKVDLSSVTIKGGSTVSYDNTSGLPHATIGFKFSMDGSYAHDGSTCAGMVLRDDKRAIIFSSCRQLFSCRDSLEAELNACMEGLSFAIQRSDLQVEIEMDSTIALKLIQAKEVDRSVYSSLIMEIRYLMSLLDSFITHVNRSQNKVSDTIAKFIRLEGRTMT
ncbi:hypothetical protein ZWY2020_004310 [Hordeum vulgare]|nr:hypothetical protein ZWY2020_004310 [Hordeum vulgare]